MKLITFAVPSYNSQDYLHKCIESLLLAGNECEIIIINDGSTDNTLKIAKDYQNKYPNIIKVIDKENGGHGSGVNSGLKAASGLYFKVVDSDDWADAEGLKTLINTIKSHLEASSLPDLYITNFIYEKVSEGTTFVRSYEKHFKTNTIFNWDQTLKKFKYSATLLMHALVYKTSALRLSGTKLPEHTFYVDNIVAYLPLPFMAKVYYIPEVFYHYFIGRSDQSIQMHNIIARYEQQIRVMKIMFETYSYQTLKQMPKGLRKYMFHNLSVMMIMTQMFTIGDYSSERKRAIKEMWQAMKKQDIKLYRKLMFRSYTTLVNILPWRLRSKVLVKGYLYFANKIKLG